MTNRALGAIESVIAKVDWLSERGSFVMRAAAIVTWLGAIAATVLAFSTLGGFGLFLGALALIPGWLLWRFAGRLTRALDVDLIRGQLAGLTDLARSRLGDVVAGIQQTRTSMMRGGLTVLKTVRAVRDDLGNVGIDVTGIAEIANPASLSVAAISLFAGLGLWIVAGVALLLRYVF